MKDKKKDLQTTGMAGEFLSAGKLFKRGYQVSVTYGNAKAIDLFVFNSATGKTFNVQVKTQRRKNCFPMKKENVNEDHVYIFVRLNDVHEEEEFFIVPGKVILGNLDGFFGSSYANPEKPSSMPGVNYGPLSSYRDAWGIFDQ